MVLAVAGAMPAVGRAAQPTGTAAEAWFWRSQLPASSGLALPAPDPEGHLPIAARAGEWEKVVLLQPEEAPVTGTLQLALTAPGDVPAGDVLADDAALAACLVTEPWVETTAEAWDLLPAIDCTRAAPGSVEQAATGNITATFDLQPLVRAWAGGAPSFGVAVVPDLAQSTATSTWQVTFAGSQLGGVAFQAVRDASVPVGGADPATPAPALPGVAEQRVGLPSAPIAPGAMAPPSDPVPDSSPAAGPPPHRRATRGVTGMLPFDRAAERAAATSLAVLTAALILVALAPLPSRRIPRPFDSRHFRVAMALWLAAALAILFAWSGTAGQVLVAAQVPYLVSGGLVAAVLMLGGATTLLAEGLRHLPPSHPWKRLVRRR